MARTLSKLHFHEIPDVILSNIFSLVTDTQDLVLDVCNNVSDVWPALEFLNSKYPRLKSLKLGEFHGICRPDGFALCRGLESLSIKNFVDLTDSSLISISLGIVEIGLCSPENID
ncbi:hypothetical protein Ddye_024204 [Dipteronia dyeriana]|uniref:Uncharacterized protein n=1 Tax=Dipteronia dyeriana TaxID=168575 RepID=A0AAD9TV09_9ROSI|nr:hypothetical protein Ddye_024204 [Dipteronia dyeriana]